MRTGGVPSAALLLVLSTILLQVSAAADIYWEGEEDASNEFLEVKHDDNSLFDRLKRIKRDGWDFFNPFGFNKDDEAVTEADDGSSYGADDMDNYGSGSVDVDRAPDLSEPREKTLRVTFTAIEPYRLEYSNRDSPQFLDFSHSLASAVDALFDKLPGTQKSSLVRIQSLVVDEFSCKVTLDIVTTGFDDTDTIESILRDHIKNNGRLGKSIVTINGFNAQLIDPATEDLGKAAPVENSTEYTYVGENNTYISSQDNGNPDDQDNDYTNPEIFLPENNNVITNTDQSKSEQGPDNSDLDSQQPDVPPYYDPYSQYNSTIPDNQENTVDYTPGRGDGGRLGETDVTEEQSTPGVSWYSPEPTQPATNEVDNDSTTRRPISEPNESVCSDDYLRCDQTRCVENFRRCDGVKDCYDETDEAGCPDVSCSRDDFKCNNGKCIEADRRCDKVFDCEGQEDELGCECLANEFRCVSDGSCIEERKRCDNVPHCRDGSDEADCGNAPVSRLLAWAGNHTCLDTGRFRCSDGKCISILLRCDGFKDCSKDGNDEIGCPCGPDQWQCDHGSCIKRKFRCDGRVDCPTDRSDERNCIASGSFRCATGKFIPEYQRCNRRYDCPPGDFSDEQNCPCGATDFKCDNGHCIPASKRCDRTHDCQDRSDERHCTYGTLCMAYEYECKSGMCVPAEARCNSTVECDDGTDEIGCSCKRDQYPCRDGSCINIAFLCNGREDCSNGEDEYNCRSSCPADQFTCPSGGSVACAVKCNDVPECEGGEDEDDCQDGACAQRCDDDVKCIMDHQICDRNRDCNDGSDERDCNYCDRPEDFSCQSGECISYSQVCNEISECADGSDEQDCNRSISTNATSCGDNQFTCRSDLLCIDISFQCDGNADCNDKSDESNCPWYMTRASRSPAMVTCHESEFTCYDGRCIPQARRCDNIYDCSDFSDEQNCYFAECRMSDSWQCRNGQCIPSARYCDDIPDCSDGSDEYDCPVTSRPFPVTTTSRIYPDSGSGSRYPSVDSDSRYPSPDSGNGYPGSNPDGRYPGPDSGSRYPGSDTGNRYPASNPDSRYPGSDSGSKYPGSDTGNGYPGSNTDSRYPTSDSSNRYPGPDSGNGYPGAETGNGYPGSNTDSRYPGSDSSNRYPGSDSGNGYPGSNTGNGSPGSNTDSRYPGSDSSNRYPGSDSGNGYPGSDAGNGYPGSDSGNGYPGSDAGNGYPGSNTDSRYPSPDSGNGYPGAEAGNGYPGSDSSSVYSRPGGGSGNTQSRPTYDSRYPSPNADADRNGACKPFQWRCENGPCIDVNRRCDGHIDCPFDVSDEFDCPPNSPVTLKLVTHPSEQSIRNATAGGDVVFRCRDEGPKRAKVKWYRDGRPIKQGSSDVRGRLEMYQVTQSDSGTYYCRADDYAGYPGSEVQVTLIVESPPVTHGPFVACQPYEATCGNGQCIPKSAVCNNKVDCSDGSDEEHCHRGGMCEPNEFKCNNRKCVLKTWICDSEDDCGDGSDEQDCSEISLQPQGQCLPTEYSCKSGDQCIPRSFHCDQQSDCLDGSDEIGCMEPHVTRPPQPSNVKLSPGETLILRAEAAGVPMPLISWRLNWGHVPAKCTSTSENGIGILTCPDMQPEDSGAYSAEAINNKGTSFGTPDSIVFVTKTDLCRNGYFNSEARSESECIRCFCFGKSTQCHSADLFTYTMPTPLGEGGTRLVGIQASRSSEVNIDPQPITGQYFYSPLRNGATVTKSGDVSSWSNSHPYLTLPETYTGNQLKSYGGHIKYILSPQTQVYGFDDAGATIIIKGKYGNLFHINRSGGTRDIQIEARLTPEDWSKYPDGSAPASREDIMMVLDDIEMILLRADLNNAGVNITNFAMESADHINVNLGVASLVEECSCPKGYEGLSCQKCASGFIRKKVGPWLGNCEREECPPGTYGDPASGIPCSPCPCPLTNQENQFARTCSLGHDGSVICDCFQGYTGKNCEACAEGYEGNPLVAGDRCQPKKSDNCNPVGTTSIRPPDECVCKDNVEGRYCDQCKRDSFYLSEDFNRGCALCFCTGVSQKCMSSNYRRRTTSVQFNVPAIVDELKVYNSAPSGLQGSVRYSAPKETDLRPQLQRGDISLDIDRSSRNNVYYWSMPASFAGDKVTSYGGFLRYTLKDVPSSVDPRYRNTAADVQLISDNQLTFHYFGDYSVSHDKILNVSIQFLEKGWQRQDGKEVTREHFLLALADVKTILVKATYAPVPQIATPVSASIETAEPDAIGPTAYHVEQCVCPEAYIGTSCEDCAPGYTRSSGGLYLQHCEPCECNGKSTMCHPETGVCYDCADNTDGEQCETCKLGYEPDEYGKCVESYRGSTSRPCSCDPRGTSEPCDSSGYCACKQNVEGDSCDRCRPGTFALDARNPQGCLSCFCSGVTSDCYEGTHYTRMPLPVPVLGDNYGGFTITDLKAERVIKDNFSPLFEQSELMYNFAFRPDVELYWSLPVLPGNRVLSYGGSINLRQKFSSNDDQMSNRGTDVVLDGADISIYWTNPNQFNSGVSYNYQIPLNEDGWFILNSVTPASRSDFMNVLKNLKRALVRATVAQNIYETTIADVFVDTAVPQFDSQSPAAKSIEICKCPPGYSGTSCESCNRGFYKNQFGYCEECPCNGHDCQIDSSGKVSCICQPPNKGPDCSIVGLIMELHPTIDEAAEDDTFMRRVTFTCKYRAPEPLTIKFFHEDVEQLPPKYFNESRLEKDGWHSEHVWHTVWDTRYEGEKYECHTVTERGFTLGVLTTSLPEPGGDSSVTEPSTRAPPPEPTVSVTIISPTIMIQEVGSSVNFTCRAQSRNVPQGRLPISWTKSNGLLPLERSYVTEGILTITNLQVADSGVYICETSDGINTAQATATLKVPGNQMTQPSVEISPSVKEYYEGDRIQLECRVQGNPTPSITWMRGSNRPLPLSAQYQGSWFIVDNARVEDAGEYRCLASNTVGSDHRTAMITIRPRPIEPPRETLTVSNNSPTVEEGQSIRIVCTGTTNVPAGSLDWVRQDNAVFMFNVRSENGVLYIDNAEPDNQGVYICQSPLTDIAPIPILVTVINPNPSPEVYKVSVSVDRLTLPTGGSGTVDCNPAGRPLPLIKWFKHDGDFGPQSSQRGNTLIISNAQDSDQGYYVCEALVNGASVAKQYVFVQIERRDPPRVEIWPQGEQSVQLGGQYELHCRVLAGIPEPDVTWNRNGARPLSRSTEIRPNNVLKFNNIEVNDEGEYTCTARNDAGTVSASAVIKVRAAPELTITPSSYISAAEGQPFTVECRASGYPEPMVSISMNDYEIVAPQPGHVTLAVRSASSSDDGYYTCTGMSVAGSSTEQFVVNVLTRGDIYPEQDQGGSGDGDYSDPNAQDPYELPSTFYVIEGQAETSISCNETGNVKWERSDSMPFAYNVYQNESRLVLRNVGKSASGEYVCNILDQYNEVYKAVYTIVVVVSAPNITLIPATQTVQPGQSPTVECVVNGDDIIGTYWRPYNRDPPSRMEIRGNKLIFHNIEVEDAGKYECIARSKYANSSSIAEVIVSEDSDRTWVSHDNEQWAHAGAAVHLSCNLTQPNTRIEWTKDGRPLPRSVNRKSDGSLFLRLAHKSDTGRYVCSVRDAYGRVLNSNYIDLHIQGYECLETEFRCYDDSSCIDENLLCDGRRDCQDNSDEENCMWRDKRFSDTVKDSLTHDGPRDSESQQLVYIEKPSTPFREGDNVDVPCKIRYGGVKVQWRRSGTNQFVDSVTYGDGAVLTIPRVSSADAGLYRCLGSDVHGRRSSDEFELKVESSGYPSGDYERPGANIDVAEYTAHLGDAVDLPCQHNLEPPVSIEWKREYLSLPPEVRSNQPTLRFPSVTETHAGTYVCRVTNRRASIETSAILTVKGVVPRFDGSGYISMPTLKDAYRQFEFEVSFKPTDENGLILYNSQNQGRTGDFIALQLKDGIPEFIMNTGTDTITEVKYDRPLQLNVWHTIRIRKTGIKVTMDVDNKGPFVAESPDQWTVLDLQQPLYIGGVPDYDQLPANLAGASGFIGCVSMLILGADEKNIMTYGNELVRIQECDSCIPNLCQNNGFCQEYRNEHGYICNCAPGFAGLNCDRTGDACRPGICGPGKCFDTETGYKCSCPVTHTGKSCEVKQSIEYPAFTGSSFVALKTPDADRGLKMSFNIKAAPPLTDGIIMYCSESNRGYGGFISLAVHNGKLEFRYDLAGGSQPIVLVSDKLLSTNEWTTVQIARVGAVVSLKIGAGVPYEKLIPPAYRQKVLPFETPIFLGGVDESYVMNNNTGVSEGFYGCIKDIVLGGRPVNIVNQTISSANVRECASTDSRGDIPEGENLICACRNGGQCVSASEPTVCSCPAGYTGQYCEKRASVTMSDPCLLKPCRNGGKCRPNLSARMNHTCDCPLGFGGMNCQIPLMLDQSVSFSGNGYLELPASKLNYDNLDREPAIIAMSIYTHTDGVLLYQKEAQVPADYGDYMLLRIERGLAVFDWDLGGGKLSVTVNGVYVNDGERHQIIVKLFSDGSVDFTVDSYQARGTSTGIGNVMNANSNIYIGGIPEALNQYAYPGFNGCISQIELMETRPVKLGESAVAGRNAQRCKDLHSSRDYV